MKKTFDCVAMKRRGAARINRQTEGMTIAQQLIYWRHRTQALKLRKKSARVASFVEKARHEKTAR